MATDPPATAPRRTLPAAELHPLGEDLAERPLQRHRTRAGLRIGDGERVDLPEYTARLVGLRQFIVTTAPRLGYAISLL